MKNSTFIKNAFTLAEILITIGITGIIAAISIPTLLSNVSDIKYRVIRKRALNNIGEAVQLLAADGEVTAAKDAEDFVKNYLSKHLKIIATCPNDRLNECGLITDENAIFVYKEKNQQGIPDKRTMPKKMSDLNSNMSSSNTVDPNLKSYGFIMANGFSVNLFYNPKCWNYSMTTASNEYRFKNFATDYVCVNAIYDSNGASGPNYAGKDIGFVSVLYSDKALAVAPDIYRKNVGSASYTEGQALCNTLGKDFSMLTLEDFSAMVFNRTFFNYDYGGTYWILHNPGQFGSSSWGGYLSNYNENTKFLIRCKRK